MKEPTKLVDASSLKTLEQYAASLCFGIISLRSLELYHIQAAKEGLLKEDEQELITTIAFEIGRLVELYKCQFTNVMDRSEFTETDIQESLQGFYGAKPKTRKKKEIQE